jgi:hypothetical protein
MSDGSDLGSDTPTQAPTGTSVGGGKATGGIDWPAPASPPSDTSGDAGTGDDGTGASIEVATLPDLGGGSSSLVSDVFGLGRQDSGDASLHVDLTGNDGVNVSLDGNDGLVANLNGDTSQGGLRIDVDGATGDGGLIGFGDANLIGVGEGDSVAGLIGDTGSLIDIDFDQSDGQTAAILDVVASGDSDTQAALLGSEVVSDGSADILGSTGLLDGALDIAL